MAGIAPRLPHPGRPATLNNMGKVGYIIVQLTWGILQSAAGAVVLATQAGRPHRMHHGAVVTEWPSRFGLSLGMFIFIGTRDLQLAASSELEGSLADRLLVHEYGHTLQSLALGPLYLLVIGLPSLIWARSHRLAACRRRDGRSYYDFYTERWANAWGERILHRPAMR